MFDVYAGNKEAKEAQEELKRLEYLAIASGYLSKVIPLNGSSETRREMIKYYLEAYSNIYYVTYTSFSVTLRSKKYDLPF